jgi:MFS family permease
MPPAAKALNDQLTPSLRAANRDGMAWAIMVGAGESFLNVFGVFLNATHVQLSLITTLPQFFGAFFQMLSLWVLQIFHNRRHLIVVSSLFNACSWALLAVLAFWGPGAFSVPLMIAIVACYHASGNFAAPPWNSLIGDLVPAEIRGRYFGLRNRWIGLCTFTSVIFAGQILDLSKRFGDPRYGFCAIFVIAFLSRLASVYYLKQYDNPAHDVGRAHYFSFWQFISRTHRSNFARFVIYAGIVNAAVNISAPFFAVYMLNTLHFSYIEFTIVTAANTITQFLTLQHWGAISDQFGNKRIMNVCGFAIALSPVLWVFGTSIPYLLCIQIFAGFVWAGFNLAVVNFIFDAVSPPKRARCVAYQSLINGTLVLFGALFGAWFIEAAPSTFSVFGWSWTPISSLHFVFAFSGAIRLCASLLLLPLFKEVRDVTPVKHGELILRVTSLRALTGATFSFIPGVRRRP